MSDLTPLARLLEHHDERTLTYERGAPMVCARKGCEAVASLRTGVPI